MGEFIMGLVGGLVALLLGVFLLKDKDESGTTEKEQQESNATVDSAEEKAAKQQQEANDAHENASNDTVVKRFLDVFSKRPGK